MHVDDVRSTFTISSDFLYMHIFGSLLSFILAGSIQPIQSGSTTV